MELVSTRDEAQKGSSYTDVLLAGLAPDGGLYVPKVYPTVTESELEELRGQPYVAVASLIKKKLVGEAIDGEQIEQMVEEAYSSDAFTDDVDGSVTPVRSVVPGLYLQNLSLGPTAAFKDMAMQLLGQEMEYELGRRQESLRILGATSGDTGSAAEAAMKGLERIQLFMLSPEEGMSAFQKAQMGALSGGNIFNVSVKGRFDDCQDMVKAIKADPEFADLGAVNSINWGRISSQVPYYFSGYLQVVEKVGDPVDFVVPSGNFGNVLSGYIAKQMGLPIRKLVVATNENNVLHKLFTTGVYELTPAEVTSSPSMDISKASNYERLVFDLLGKDPVKTAEYMKQFAETGRVDLADFGVSVADLEKLGFVSDTSTHADRLAAIKRVFEETGQPIDPHTADGVHVALGLLDESSEVPMICMETALAVKFEDTIKEAIGTVPERPARFADLESGIDSDAFTVMGPDEEELKEFIRSRS